MIFDTVDLAELQKDGNDAALQVQYDYMKAYFDFFVDDQDMKFANARAIVQKYQNYPIEHFKVMFNKIKEQLDEIDEGENQTSAAIVDVDQDEELDDEQKRKAAKANAKKAPVIHNIDIDKHSGQIKIEQNNIDKFLVKYYLIDAEILFSRSPFVKDQAEKFSYVKPYHVLEQSSNNQEEVLVAMPDNLIGKNVVIEINSDDIQKFLIFYSSQLEVQVNEALGVLKVFHRDTMEPLPRVYVKIFSKAKSGAENFYKDGFTDITGKFEYANASGKSLNEVDKFSILVCDREYGSTINEYKNLAEGATDSRPVHEKAKRYGTAARGAYGGGGGGG